MKYCSFTFQHFRNMYANYTDVQQLPYGVRECSKRVYTLNLNRFLLINSEMWIQTVIKLPRPRCLSKNSRYSAGDFYGGGERKTLDSDGINITNYPLYMVKITYVPLRNNYRPNRAYEVSSLKQHYFNIFF